MKRTKALGAQGVRRYWEKNAHAYGLSHEASWADRYAIELEVREIARQLEEGDCVLDAGCGNGFTAMHLASKKRVYICGIDYVPAMIRNARRRLKASPKLSKRVEFKTGDITRLSEASGTFDKVVAVRLFINLTRQADVRKALGESARVLKPNGRLLLSDATLEGWKRLNQMRAQWKLAAIPIPVFNRYLHEKELVRMASKDFRLVEVLNFSSTYFFGTRVLKPLLIQALGLKVNPADPLTEWNRFFSELPAWGDYGTQKLFVFEKK